VLAHLVALPLRLSHAPGRRFATIKALIVANPMLERELNDLHAKEIIERLSARPPTPRLGMQKS
jgi:hypothetical protein